MYSIGQFSLSHSSTFAASRTSWTCIIQCHVEHVKCGLPFMGKYGGSGADNFSDKHLIVVIYKMHFNQLVLTYFSSWKDWTISRESKLQLNQDSQTAVNWRNLITEMSARNYRPAAWYCPHQSWLYCLNSAIEFSTSLMSWSVDYCMMICYLLYIEV
jgi:hypothetical protein